MDGGIVCKYYRNFVDCSEGYEVVSAAMKNELICYKLAEIPVRGCLQKSRNANIHLILTIFSTSTRFE